MVNNDPMNELMGNQKSIREINLILLGLVYELHMLVNVAENEKKKHKINYIDYTTHITDQVKAGNIQKKIIKKEEKMLIRSENKKIYFPQPQKFQTII